MSESIAPNPYAAPASNLQEAQGNQAPSIDEALRRGYDFSIGDLISESWQRVKGTKGIIFGGFLIFYVVMLVASTVIGAIFGVLGFISETSITGITSASSSSPSWPLRWPIPSWQAST